ncbi:hypothetical protein Tco_0746586 [Tanacetum coccineum]
MANNETECSPSEVCLSDSDSELLIPTSWSDESKNEKRAKRWREEFEWKRSLFEIDLTFGINAFDLDKGTEMPSEAVKQGMDDHVLDETDGAKDEHAPNLVVKKGNLESLICKQVANHVGDELVEKGRSLKRKRVYGLLKFFNGWIHLLKTEPSMPQMKLEWMKLLDGTMDEVCYQLLKMIEKQAGIRK